MDFQTLRQLAAQTVSKATGTGDLGRMMADEGVSALSEMLDLPPRRVPFSGETLPDDDYATDESDQEEPNPFDAALSELEGQINPEPEEAEYIPLSTDEITAKAEAKTEMWAAIMALIFSLMGRMVAYQKLTERDMKYMRQCERDTERMGRFPDYDDNHPYWEAKEHYTAYQEAMNDEQQDIFLDDAQKSLLQRAIEADLRSKNTREAIKQSGIAMTIGEIMLTKATEPLMGMGMVLMSRMTERSLKR